MEAKPPELGGPSDAGFPAKYPANKKTLAGRAHAALRTISFLRGDEIYFASKGQGRGHAA